MASLVGAESESADHEERSDVEDMMKILVATDNHIGYMEKDQVRFNDSLEAFEEVLKVAKSENVDFILLGGDLFHENKPSRQTLHRSMELLRYYCMGSRPCSIEFRSDPTTNFHHSKFPVVNYEDPNYNVSIPVFTIHGNHDDPVGEGSLSAMDILHVSNLINYFGKVEDIEKIELSPVLLQKGETKLALYGLGSCRDERLHRMFRKGNVKFLRPNEEEGGWFNILVLHQNRAKHGATNYIPPSFIPDFFDLVIWGHEHECLLEPQFVPTGGVGEDEEEKGLFISQPGSSIATSLSDGEQKSKHCGILYIKSDCSFKLDPVALKTVRPFILDSVSLSDTGIHPQDNDEVESFLTNKVSELVEEARKRGTNDKRPLVRLKVDYRGGYSTFSLARFGQKFLDKVANPKNILLWHCRREKQDKRRKTENGDDNVGVSEGRVLTSGDISEYLTQEVAKEKIELLSDKNMAEALHEFVDKMENDSVDMVVQYSLEVSQGHLKGKKVKEADIDNYMDQKKDDFFKMQETEGMEAVRKELADKRAKQPNDLDVDDSGSDSSVTASEAPRGRGRGRGRGSRGRGTGATRGRGRRGRAKKATGSIPSSSASPMAGLEMVASSTKRSSNRTLNYEDDSMDTPFPSKKRKVDIIELSDDEDMEVPTTQPIQKSRRTKK